MQQKKQSKRLIIPIFLNHKGCPHRCIYCNQKSAVGISIKNLNEIDDTVKSYIKTQIEKYGKINPKYETTQLAFYGGSFTCLEKNEMINLLKIGKKYIYENFVDSLRVSTRPDCISEEILKILKEYKVKTVELGCESFSDNILKILNRGHTVEDIIKAYNLLKKEDFEISLQIMIGLPEEKDEDIEKIIYYLKELKPDFVRLFPLIVLKNTYLEKMYRAKIYKPITLEKAIKILGKIYKNCIEEGIKVIQIGLHYSEHLLKNYVAGPIHPRIGELVINSVDTL